MDCDYLYRDVVIGWPGSVHDARVFSNSAIFDKGRKGVLFPLEAKKEVNGKELLPFLVADPAYPLLTWVMKGYQIRENAPKKERVFNYRLSRAGMTAENTFGRWKGRLIRFSKRVDMEVPKLVSVILASCILHNVCELQRNNFLPQWAENRIVQEEIIPFNANAETSAEDIRESLAQHFIS